MAHGPGGNASATATVTVSVIQDFTVSPNTIGAGETADLVLDAPTAFFSTIFIHCSAGSPTLTPVSVSPTHVEYTITGGAPTSCTYTATAKDEAGHTSSETRTLTVH